MSLVGRRLCSGVPGTGTGYGRMHDRDGEKDDENDDATRTPASIVDMTV